MLNPFTQDLGRGLIKIQIRQRPAAGGGGGRPRPDLNLDESEAQILCKGFWLSIFVLNKFTGPIPFWFIILCAYGYLCASSFHLN